MLPNKPSLSLSLSLNEMFIFNLRNCRWDIYYLQVCLTICKVCCIDYHCEILFVIVGEGSMMINPSRKDDDKFPIFLFIHLKQQIFGEVGEAGADWDIFQISCVCF